MKKFLNSITKTGVALILILNAINVQAGNEDRVGQAGGQSLLVNPWARSNGWAGANTANSVGLESMFLNVAGTAFTKKM